MRQVKIKSVEELIQFIKETDLSLNDYARIIGTYSGVPFATIREYKNDKFTSKDKERLIKLIEKYKDSHIEKGRPIPSLILGQ